jgi:AraC-like DNA-binding protein
MWDNNLLYEYSVLAGSVTTFVLALCLFLVKPPQIALFDVYRRSRLMLGAGYAAYALGIGVFVVIPLRSEAPLIASAVNLTYYLAAEYLFGCSFISLLDPAFCSAGRMRRYVLSFCAAELTLWGGAALVPSGRFVWVLAGVGIWFLIQAGIMTLVFLKSYRRLKRQLEYNYADTTVTFIRWLHLSAWCVIIFGMLCGLSLFFSKMWLALLMSAGILVFIYIYVSVENYALHLPVVQYVAENPLEESGDMVSGEGESMFVRRLEAWIAGQGYCDADITLEVLAERVGTNRSYLSGYINRHYGKSFSTWINEMRLERARHLLGGAMPCTVAEVVEMTGFSSVSYFGKLFRKAYGVTPTSYRNR